MPIPRSHTYGFTHHHCACFCLLGTVPLSHILCHAKKSLTAQNPHIIEFLNICLIFKCKSSPFLFSFFVLVAFSLASIHITPNCSLRRAIVKPGAGRVFHWPRTRCWQWQWHETCFLSWPVTKSRHTYFFFLSIFWKSTLFLCFAWHLTFPNSHKVCQLHHSDHLEYTIPGFLATLHGTRRTQASF